MLCAVRGGGSRETRGVEKFATIATILLRSLCNSERLIIVNRLVGNMKSFWTRLTHKATKLYY